jgi:hypothetical protein
LRLYRVLWAAEFRIRPKQEHDAERRIVAEDLERLRTFASVPDIQTVMTNGARLAGDDALTREIASKRPPDVFAEYSEWQKTHPYPKPDDPADKKRAHAQAQLEAATRWIAFEPDGQMGYSERLHALVALEAPADDLRRTGDDLLAADRRSEFGPHSYFISVAQAYFERGVLLDRVPAILEEALTKNADGSPMAWDLRSRKEVRLKGELKDLRWATHLLARIAWWFRVIVAGSRLDPRFQKSQGLPPRHERQ